MRILPSFRVPLGVLMLSSLCAAPLMGQEKERKPDRLLRILPVGEAPPYVEKIVDGVRIEQDAPEGSIPPRRVVQMTKEGQERGNPVRLQLDRLSAPVAVSPGTIPLFDAGAGGAGKPWHSVKVPKTTHSLAVLWRDPAKKKWSDAKSITLIDDVRSFPAGRVRFVNVSPYSVGISYKGEKSSLGPGKILMKTQTKPEELKVLLKTKSGKWLKVFDSQLNQRAGERTNVIIYKADGNKPRLPAKVRLMRERAKLPAPPRNR